MNFPIACASAYVIPSRADNTSSARTEEPHKRSETLTNCEVPRVRSGCPLARSLGSLRILLIQLRRLGDLILTPPAISALREHLPGTQIALAVSRECESLLPAI